MGSGINLGALVLHANRIDTTDRDEVNMQDIRECLHRSGVPRRLMGQVLVRSMLCLGLATLAHSLTVWAPVSRDVNLLLMNIGGL